MADRPLPEAIRGAWYSLPEDGSPAEALEEGAELLALHIDGVFARYDIDGDQRELIEDGDYTFDGDFLILRARNTETYRVHIEAPWHWFLEGKKKSRRLYRGLLEPDDFFELSDRERNEIKTLPMKVRAESIFANKVESIFELTYQNDDGDSKLVGYFSVDTDTANGALWVGVTPVATNLDEATWEKVIRKSYIAAHESDHDAGVSIEILA